MRISRCIALTLQPRATNSVASQSSSSGWLGAAPAVPKLSGVETIPSPKWSSQIRLTITRAVSGWPGWVSHRANASRRPLVGASFAGGDQANGFGVASACEHSRADLPAGLGVVAALEDRRLHVTRQVVKGADLGECPLRRLARRRSSTAIPAACALYSG